MTSKKSTSAESPHTATLTRSCPDEPTATVLVRSLRQEAGAIPGERAAATVSQDEKTVVIHVTADDLTALRAGTFTWCGLLETAASTVTIPES